MADLQKMIKQLILHEGIRPYFYDDATGKALEPGEQPQGNKTWGIGYNVTSRGLGPLQVMLNRAIDARGTATEEECREVLVKDIGRVEMSIQMFWGFFAKLDEVRQRVCVDMAFNLGFKALEFKKAMQAIERRDWSAAAREMHKSRWAGQVGARADRLARMMLTGEDYTS
jgi:lysozyme